MEVWRVRFACHKIRRKPVEARRFSPLQSVSLGECILTAANRVGDLYRLGKSVLTTANACISPVEPFMMRFNYL